MERIAIGGGAMHSSGTQRRTSSVYAKKIRMNEWLLCAVKLLNGICSAVRMDLRNKWSVHIVRSLLGFLMLVMGITGLYFTVTGLSPEIPGETEAIKTALAGLTLSGIVYVVKAFEIVAGIMLLMNFRPALATLLLAPIIVGIMTYDLVLWTHMPEALTPAVLAFFGTVYLGYVYWDKYEGLFDG